MYMNMSDFLTLKLHTNKTEGTTLLLMFYIWQSQYGNQ